MAYQPLPPVGQDDMAGSLPVVVASDQSAVPVSGTVTANVGTVGTLATAAKQDTGNTSLATLAGAVADTEVQVDVLSSALPSGASTSAKQDTIIGHVDGIEALLTTIDADTGNISTKIDTLAGAVSGTEVQVDVLTMPTVTVDSELPAAAALADNASNPTTPMVGADLMGFDGAAWDRIRTVAAGDAAATGLLAAGAYGYNGTTWDRLRSDTTNGLDVDVTRVSGTVTVDGSGVTQPVSNAALTELAAAINSDKVDVNIASSAVSFGGTSAADDADFTAGTTAGTPSMGVYESTPTSVTDGDLGTVGITQGRRLKTSATIDAALPAGTNNIGDVDVLSSALPTGASTSAKQDSVITELQNIDAGKLEEATFTGRVGEVQASPTANTVLGRLKDIDDAVSGTLTVQATNLDVRDLSAASDAVTVHGDVGAVDQLDLTNSNPVTVAIVDGDGTQITSFGGGTQYTEDAAAAANPVGTALIGVRADSLSGVTSADGDNVAARMTDKGELYVKHADNLTVNAHAVTNAGTFAVQVDGSALTALQLVDDIVGVEDAAETAGRGLAMMGSVRRDTAASSAGTTGDNATINTDANGNLWATLGTKLDSTNDSIAVHAVTTGGATPYKLNSAATTNATNVKASAGQIYNIVCMNTNADERYLKIYNKASSPTVGTDTPVQTYTIPGSASGGGFSISFPVGMALSSGISFALTTEATDAGTTAVAANEILVNLTYK